MLKRLEIRNFALIGSLRLEPGPGMNVFTGETGAGKSIIIEAIGFLLGERASSDMVRSGSAQAEVSGIFLSSALRKGRAAHYGLKGAEFNVRRQLDANGKTKGFLDGRPVSAAILSELGDELVDFHGQNEHQSLMRPEVQLAFLDRYGRLETNVAAYAAVFEARKALLERMNAVSLSHDEKERLLELYRFQAEEIDSAGLKEGEEEELLVLFPRLKNAQKLSALSENAYQLISAGDNSSLSQLEKAVKELSDLAALDESASVIGKELDQAVIAIRDAGEELYRYSKALDTDPAGLDACLSRLDKISVLKKKYGASVADVIRKGEELRRRIAGLEDSDLDKKELAGELARVEKKLSVLADALHDERAAAAKKLSSSVLREISGLGFKEVKFSVAVECEEGRYTASGIDNVDFMFSANPGHPLKPLKAVASGGEMSRVMLGIKTVLAASDNIPVLVFDEVDTGVGSTVGRMLGDKLSRLSRNKQLFCITHMPQIAAFCDSHFYVEKSVKGGMAEISVSRLSDDQSAAEIARMLGGKQRSSELGLKHALELIKESKG